MEKILTSIILLPVAALFTGLGIFSMKRKKPMHFYAGSEVKPWQIKDIPAYNKANGWMWIVYSLGFWAAIVLGLFNAGAAGLVMAIWCLGGIPVLVIAYKRIYKKYKA